MRFWLKETLNNSCLPSSDECRAKSRFCIRKTAVVQCLLNLFLFPLFLLGAVAYADDESFDFDDDAFMATSVEEVGADSSLIGWSLFRSSDDEDKYIINFTEVSAVEYLRFVAKISNINFQYELSDLRFPISVISEEPMTVQSIVSGLIQTLRARGFYVLEQDGTLMITRSSEVKQIPKVILFDDDEDEKAPIVTRVFRIENGNLSSIVNIIRPMMSKNALVEVSTQTRQLIVTDLTTNIEKLATLLQTLDSPHSPLEIDSYQAEYISASSLIVLAKALVEPFAEGNPVTYVAQDETNTVYIVSTPPIVERSIEVMEDLDVRRSEAGTGPVGDLVFLYNIKHRSADDLLDTLKGVAKELEASGAQSLSLIASLKNARVVPNSNSILFVTNSETKARLEVLLDSLDSLTDANTYWIYTPQYLSGREIEKSLRDLEDNLASSGYDNEGVIGVIRSMRWVPETNTLLFSGDEASLKHVESMIKLLDVESSGASRIFLYQPKFLTHTQIEEALDELADKLDSKNLSDRNLAAAIDDLTWIAESQSFLFKADPASIDKIETFLSKIDVQVEADAITQTYVIYGLKTLRGDDVLDQLEQIAKHLPEKDPNQRAVALVIDNITYLEDSNSLLLTGPKRAVEEVVAMLEQFDLPTAGPQAYLKTSFFIYKPVHLAAEELAEALRQTATDLKDSGLVDPSLLESIDTLQMSEVTGSLIFTGTKESLEKTAEIIKTIDVPGARGENLGEFAGHSFFIYKVLYVPLEDMMAQLRSFTENLEKERGKHNDQLIKTLQDAKIIKESKSILFTGAPQILEKVASIVKQLDTPGGIEGAEETRVAGIFVVYKPVNISGPELIDMMGDFEKNLAQSGIRDLPLYETIDNLKYIQRTGYILVSGGKQSVEQVIELLKKFDIQGAAENGASVTALIKSKTSFLVYKLQYHSGDEIQQTLKKVGKELASTNPDNQELLNAINSIQWVKVTNSLLATGTPETLTQLKELIENVDVPLRQVFIEVLIIRTTILNNQQFGLQWGGKVQYLSRFAGGISNFPSPNQSGTANQTLSVPLGAVNNTRTPLSSDIPNPSTTGGGLDLGVIGDIILHKGKSFFSLASLVTAIQQDNDSVVVLNPKIIAQDNQMSTIFVGQNIPFVGSTIETIQGGGSQTSSNIEYRDVGINLSITPMLGASEIITLDVSNEITEQVDDTTSNNQGLSGLQTTRTSLNARVHVPNKHFVALSGMIQDTKQHFKSSIPCLGGLPVIGAIFSENDRLNSRDNVVFFIRPVIIDSVEVFKEITDKQETQFKELGVKQVVKEEFDEAIDLVKTPDNE